MTRTTDIARLFVVALMAITLLGALTPVCDMPECETIATTTCGGDITGPSGHSDFASACDQCGTTVVMKHTHDDATSSAGTAVPDLVALAPAPDAPQTAPVRVALGSPAITASPPPLDPLGVRLLI